MEKTIKDINLEFLKVDYLGISSLIEKYKYDERNGVKNLIIKYKKKLDFLEKEKERINKIKIFENEYYKKGYKYIAGIDEVGAGPLAGPVVAAAVILKKDIFIEKINDSKKLSQTIRKKILEEIKLNSVSIGIGIVNEKTIDEINILNARKLAMVKAVENLNINPDILLIDAISININIDQKPIIKGDEKSISIAAASIVAKETRDSIMINYSKEYPNYYLEKNKGYGSREHIDSIKKYGLSPIHRRSFTKHFI